MSGIEELADRVHRRLLDGDDVGSLDPADLQRRARVLADAEAPLLSAAGRGVVAARACARIHGLGPLDAVLADPLVTEVMVNGGGSVWVERRGRLEDTGLRLAADTVLHLIERIVGPLGLQVDRARPFVDARLTDGSRVNAVVPPLAVDGPCLTIRRFGVGGFGLAAFTPPGPAALLAWAVRARANIIVSGGTGSGKTTLLNALAEHIRPGERVITIEDTAELALRGAHVVRLEARPPNADGAGGCSVRELVRNALRMRPDRIVIGEVRGAEALDMVQAMNTGHEGSLSTCHANSPGDALRRLETMVLFAGVDLPLTAVREQLASSIDVVVQVARGADGCRSIQTVHEVPAVHDGASVMTRPLVQDGVVVALPSVAGRDSSAGLPDPAWCAA